MKKILLLLCVPFSMYAQEGLSPRLASRSSSARDVSSASFRERVSKSATPPRELAAAMRQAEKSFDPTSSSSSIESPRHSKSGTPTRDAAEVVRECRRMLEGSKAETSSAELKQREDELKVREQELRLQKARLALDYLKLLSQEDLPAYGREEFFGTTIAKTSLSKTQALNLVHKFVGEMYEEEFSEQPTSGSGPSSSRFKLTPSRAASFGVGFDG